MDGRMGKRLINKQQQQQHGLHNAFEWYLIKSYTIFCFLLLSIMNLCTEQMHLNVTFFLSFFFSPIPISQLYGDCEWEFFVQSMMVALCVCEWWNEWYTPHYREREKKIVTFHEVSLNVFCGFTLKYIRMCDARIWNSTWTCIFFFFCLLSIIWVDACEYRALTLSRSHYTTSFQMWQMSHKQVKRQTLYQQNYTIVWTLIYAEFGRWRSCLCRTRILCAEKTDETLKFTCTHSSELSDIYGCHFVNYSLGK